jgi:uncharacterized membrane protein
LFQCKRYLRGTHKTMNQSSINKSYAILCYCTLIGWIISIVQVSNKEGSDRLFTAFHLRQMLLLMLIGAGTSVVSTILFFIPYIGLVFINILSVLLVITWFMLIISAANGQKKYIPFIGESGEKMLGDMFE